MCNVAKTAQAGTLESNDIMIIVAPGDSGIVIDLQSIVLKQYGEEIRQTLKRTIEEQGITDVFLKAIDKGALDYTIRARVMTALSRAGIVQKGGYFVMEIRRSLLFIPGNNPGMLQSGGLFGADIVILDIEDSVAPSEKDAARLLVANAMRCVNYGKSEVAVRINSLDTFAKQDVEAIVPCKPDLLIIPKVNCEADIKMVVSMVKAAEHEGQKPVGLLAIIESPQGLAEAYSIARSHKRLRGLIFGAEDYTAGVGSQRTKSGEEISVARSLIVNAAAAVGIQVFDAVFTDVNDEAGLLQDTLLSKKLGFTGKPAINPRQVSVINNIFSPSNEEIDFAQRVIHAARQAEKEGSGVVSLNGKMVDAPIVNRAERVIYLAQLLGLTKEEAE